jgi:hypothetical protein
MREIPNSKRRLGEAITRALNKIRKPSTAEEVTVHVNPDRATDHPPFCLSRPFASIVKPIAELGINLPWVVPVEPAEGLTVVQLHAPVG